MIKEGGKHPTWNQTFEVNISSMQDMLIFRCMDEDLIYDALVGEGSI